MRNLGIENPSKNGPLQTNHSLRYYCKIEWRNAKTEEELHDAITGHGSSESRQITAGAGCYRETSESARPRRCRLG
ncbi:MAG: hypothetical protein JO007_11495 [Alphaproteobacteria bacterium]|nr:hypothetical protein [Alphaproteobacteria bacterium]